MSCIYVCQINVEAYCILDYNPEILIVCPWLDSLNISTAIPPNKQSSAKKN